MLDKRTLTSGSLAALKPIEKEIGFVRQRLAKNEHMPDKLHRIIRACLAANSVAARDAMLASGPGRPHHSDPRQEGRTLGVLQGLCS